MIARISIDKGADGVYHADGFPIDAFPDGNKENFLKAKEVEVLTAAAMNGADSVEVEFTCDYEGAIVSIDAVKYVDEVDGGDYEITELSKVFTAAIETAIDANWHKILKDNEPDYEPEY